MSLEINKKQEGSTLVFALKGSLDTLTSPDLQAELDKGFDGVDELIFDFSDLSYISSSGLRTMLYAWKAMREKGQMKIIHVSEILHEVFEVTGLTELLTIE